MSSDVVQGLEQALVGLARYAGFRTLEEACQSRFWVRHWEGALKAVGLPKEAPTGFFEPPIQFDPLGPLDPIPVPSQEPTGPRWTSKHPWTGKSVVVVEGKHKGERGVVSASDGYSRSGLPRLRVFVEEGCRGFSVYQMWLREEK